MTATPPRASGPPVRRVPAQWQRVNTVGDVGGLPLVTVRLDADGALTPGDDALLLAGLDAAGADDLLLFCHGWNQSGDVPSAAARAWFATLAPLLSRYGDTGRPVVLVDVHWPGRRWSDEPQPGSRRPPGEPAAVAAPGPPDGPSRRATREAFHPRHREQVDELLGLLAARPEDSSALRRARVLIRRLAEASPDDGEGERRDVVSLLEIDDPDPDQLFADFALRLDELGVITDPAGGRAGFGDSVARLWHGAQEAVRQLVYTQLGIRAAAVGERGLGPLVGRLLAERTGLGVNLVGHGLGARAVAHALRALPAGSPPVRSLILLQGALSHFAFAEKLPFDPSRSGRLAGLQERVTGPVLACHSRHDTAVGVFHPLAGRGAGPDTAGFEPDGRRWGALGHDGHQPALRGLPLPRPGVRYDVGGPGLAGIDVSAVVRRGRPPSGAHADICHPELAWIALTAAGLC